MLCAHPLSSQSYVLIARVLNAVHFSIAGYFSAPARACRRALILHPGSAEAWIAAITSYRGYRRAVLETWPARLSVVANGGEQAIRIRVQKLLEIGAFEPARAIARRELDMAPGNLAMALCLSESFEEADAERLNAIAAAAEAHPAADRRQRYAAALVAARVAQQAEDHGTAFAALQRAVGHLNGGAAVDVGGFLQALSARAAAGRSFASQGAAENGIGLVAVSGLPRSGTTLMERRLASGADLHPLGETHLIEAAFEILQSGLADRQRAGAEFAAALRGEDTRLSAAPAEGVVWYSEKMPLIAAYDGVVRGLCRQVRTVIILRPLLSTWISGLLTGMGETYAYFLDPKALLAVYAKHLDLAEVCFAAVPPTEAAVVTLEGLSEDPDGLTSSLVDRFGLPPASDAGGEGAIVRTASRGRVRGAVGRQVSDQYLAYAALLDEPTRSVMAEGDALRRAFLERHADRLIGHAD